MDPRFECEFCGREVRRSTNTASVRVDAEIYFTHGDRTLRIAHEFCSLKCLLDYIKRCEGVVC